MTPNADYYIAIDRSKRLAEDPGTGHNRWHPAIPPILTVDEGEVVALEARDAFDGQIKPGMHARDAAGFNVNRIHPMTGPVWVNGAEPGDILEVHVTAVEPGSSGFTIQGPKFGFLRDIYSDDFVVHWKINDGVATSEDLPGIRIPGAPFMGVMGVAPSHDLMNIIHRREAELKRCGGSVSLPNADAAVPGAGDIARDGLISMPPREFAGNMDIKQLSAGARVRIPVYVPGALFSTGDGHFAQGDNECCTAVEMAATLFCSFRVIKGEARRRGIDHVEFTREDYHTTAELAAPRRFYATTGLPISRDGENRSEDLNLSARNALIHMIDYLIDAYGMTRQQALVICSVAVDLRISQAVNMPNYLVSAFLPTDIFSDR
ncbi:MAG: acetamidase/formamidase family protein [Alphaproteobacteria bacterium]|nr:acetamidase/formamidase family protein [Alphaproteobacteria bacterium]